MAIMDSRVLFGENFDLDLEPSTVLLTNQVDIGVAGRDIGNGETLYLNFVVTEAFTDGGDAATLNLRLRSDSTATIHATTSTGHFETGTILKAALTLGAEFSYKIPMENNAPYEQFIGVQAVIATAGFDAGMITCWLGESSVGGWKPYAEGAN